MTEVNHQIADSDTVAEVAPARRPRPTREDRPDIIMPDGRVFRPRFRVATDVGVDERTLRRKIHETKYVGNVAYCEVNAAIADLMGEPAKQPKRRRRA